MKYADLHIHTNFSDSTYSPQEVVRLASKHNLYTISITDHDTVDAIDIAVKTASGLAIEVIPGIELTSDIDKKEVHILGYFIDHHDKGLLRRLIELRKARVRRIYKMVERLRDQGVKKIDADEVLAQAGKASVGRVHLALVMKKRGVVSSIAEAFRKYIGDNCPAYVSKFRLSPTEAIKLISDAKGIAVLAHPFILGKDEIIPELVKAGLRGIEIFYPGYTRVTISHYRNICRKYRLLTTGGSDDHGEAKEEALLGKTKIPYELVERLKRARDKIHAD